MAANKTTNTKSGKGNVSTVKKNTVAGKGTAPKGGAKRGPKAKGSSKQAASPQPEPSEFGDSLLDEIILLLIMVIAIIVLISLYTTKMGVLGSAISALFKGLFGAGGFLIPAFTLVFCGWMLFSEEKRHKAVKLAGMGILILSVSIFFHTLHGSVKSNGNGFFQLWLLNYKNGGGLNGGAIGGLISEALMGAFNAPTTYLITIALFIISLILCTGRSFFSGIGQAAHTVASTKRKHEERVIHKAERIREKQQIREVKMERKRNRKKILDIRLNENEGLQAELEEMPVIETLHFEKRTPLEPSPKKEDIFDFQKVNPEELLVKQVNQVVEELLREEPLEEDNPDTLKLVQAVQEEVQQEEPQEEISITGLFAEETSQVDTPNLELNESQLITDGSGQENSQAISVANASAEEALKTEEAAKRESQSITAAETATQVADKPVLPIKPAPPKYEFPPITLLGENPMEEISGSKTEMMNNAKKLEETLKSFGVEARVVQINKGPTVTRYELSPSQGVKVSKIVNLADDIALNLAASGIRIEAPIPGKAAVGIEVPNKEPQSVYFRDVIDTDTFKKFPSKLAFALGQDISGKPVVTDIAKMPHLLIAGATGSGKSVCINTLIVSILYKADPKEVKLILVDPKVVELSVYNGIPHLLIPVVTDPKKAAGALNWAVREMLNRYQAFAEHNVRDMKGYNAMKKEKGEEDFMPQIVIVIDELADLMMAAPGEVEDSICRLAQMARAAGLHLIIATQRPSVDVITGLIKANIPSRLAFAVSSGVDSRTILDSTGAEKLLGKGDMLFYPVGMSKPTRLQGAFITDKEVENIVNSVRTDHSAQYDQDMVEQITSSTKNASSGEDSDEFLEQAIELVVSKQKASVSMLQRQFRIGYNRAARLMEDLEDRGIVGPEEGSKPRKVLMTQEELDDL